MKSDDEEIESEEFYSFIVDEESDEESKEEESDEESKEESDEESKEELLKY